MRKILILLVSFLFLLSAESCSDFLDLEPISQATDQSFWTSEEDANSAVAAMYALTRQAFNYSNGATFYGYGDLPSDEISDAADGSWNAAATMNWSYTVASSETGNVLYRLRRYDLFYQIIDQANRVIQYLPQMDPGVFSSTTTYNHYLGEAYFMRAFTYFYISRVWGEVPLVTESVPTIDAVDYAASTTEEVFTQVKSDLAMAKTLLSWNNVSADDFAVRASKGALFALEAHVSAWLGEYEQCAAATDSVLQSGLYGYVSRDSVNYRTIFAGQSDEGIFEISQSQDNEGTNTGIGLYTLVSPYIRNDTDPDFRTTLARISTMYDEEGDLRTKSAFDLTAHTNYAICTKYANVSYTDEGSTGVRIFKNNIVVFRYSDIKLLKAEASVALGRTADALAILNEVRGKAGLSAWAQDGNLFEEVIQERGRELFMEGHRFYDLIRLAKYGGIFRFPADKMTQTEFNAGKYYWPFDPTLLVLNEKLRQTPYWRSVN